MKRTILDFFPKGRPTVDSNNNSKDENAESKEKTNDITLQSGSDSKPDQSQPKIVYVFQNSWSQKWPWVQNEEKGMMCTLCVKHKKNNAMTAGCQNYRTSTLERHASSTDHKEALNQEAMRKSFDQATTEAMRRSAAEPGLVAAIRTVYWMAQEDLPIYKYPSLIEFQKIQGLEDLTKIAVAKNATYSSRNAGEEFLECISEIIQDDVFKKFRDAEMFSLLIDESTDISVSKQMVVYGRYVDKNFIPGTHFLGNITINNPKSDSEVLYKALTEFITSKGIDLKHLYGFGSDGASVMVGRHKGVATRMKNNNLHCISIHCIAHRLNLSTSQASKDISYLKAFEQTLTDLYYYFGGSKSGNRQCELVEIQKILDDPKVKLKECHEIRWLAFYEAVSAVYKSYSSLVVYFTKHSKSSLLKKLKEYKFLYTLHMMLDILPHLSHLSMIFQKADIDVAAINPALDNVKGKIKLAEKGSGHFVRDLMEKLKKVKDDKGDVKDIIFKDIVLETGHNLKKTTKEIEDIRKSFCQNLLKNIADRFPKENSEVAMAFEVLCMRPLALLSEGDSDRDTYGEKEIDILLEHYGKDMDKGDITSSKIIDAECCKYEWALAKKIVLDQKYPRDRTRILWKLLYMYHAQTLPNMVKLANLALIMPYQTADCERGFSVQNSIKTNKRNRIQENYLNQLMCIKIEGPPIKEFNFQPVINLWKDKKERRLFNN